jgi:2-oxoglutarate ferredoxin oxidoreductase subunit beta
MNTSVDKEKLTAKDFKSDQDVRWCPGCGDYSVLAAVQRVLPNFETEKHNYVFVSGIGCSSRFPYYMNTYGFHSIHGRAPAIATGLKIANPDLEVWVISGDGDSMSIGGNHLIHAIRRNIDLKLIIFNNRIYGLTKGQYSPTSEQGKVTKSTPLGSLDHPFNPASLVLGAGGTFFARCLDRESKHLQETLARAHAHKGFAVVEVLQNCNVFNDGAYASLTDRENRQENRLMLTDGEALIFGKDLDKGIRLQGLKPEVVSLSDVPREELLYHDENDPFLANLLSCFGVDNDLPTPLGVFHASKRGVYDEAVLNQIHRSEKKEDADLNTLFRSGQIWTVQ